MDTWLIWLLIAIFFGVGEVLIMGFFMAPFCAGGLIAALASGLGASDSISIAIFLVASLLIFILIRPIAKAHRKTPDQIRTGAAALVDQTAMVVEQIANDEGHGLVKVQSGEVWTARTLNPDIKIDIGERVVIHEIRGAALLVDLQSNNQTESVEV